MAQLTYDKLSDKQVVRALADLPGWSLEDGMVTKEFAFESYAAGVVFAVACAQVAEKLNHHPDLLVGYRKVRVSFVSHDAGGLTAYDIEAARRVQALA
jgi:4a-hydroxytetrahydrobiopterin dehydratase